MVESGFLQLDACVAEVHAQYKPFRLLLTPLERRANKDEISGELRFSSLIAASKQFRSAIHTMHVDRTLTAVMKSQLAKFFNEEEARNLLGENSRCEKKKNKDLLHDDSKWADQKFLTLVIAGEVLVVRTLDEEEIGMGKCSVGCFFGAWKNLNPQDDVPESEKETPIKEGGTGVNNCIIKADGPCKIIRIPITNLSEERLSSGSLNRMSAIIIKGCLSWSANRFKISSLESKTFGRIYPGGLIRCRKGLSI